MILSDNKGIPRTREEMEYCVETGYVIPAFRNADITVELLLDYVDLKLDWYIPSVDAIDFVNFIRLCIGEEPENKNSKAQYFFIDCIFKSEEVKPYFDVRNIDFNLLKGYTLILSTREFSKSVLIAYLQLYMAVKGRMPNFGKVNFGMYVSDKMEKGNVTRNMELIEALHDSSAYLRDKFEWTHFVNGAVEFIRKPKTKKEIEIYNKHIDAGGTIKTVPQRYKRKFKIQGLGASGGRGSGSVLDRPQFAIFDDMIGNEKDAYSQAILDSIDSTIDSDVGASLSGEGNFKILIGTAYHINDPVYKRVEEATWLPVVFPKAEVPPHSDIYDAGGILVEPEVKKEDFVSVWDDRHSYEKQRKDYEIAERARDKGKSRIMKKINQEFYIRVTSEHERLIPKANILVRNLKHIREHGRYCYWYITTDLTSTANVRSNRSGIYLIAVDANKNKYIMNMSLKIIKPQQQYETILRFNKKALSYGASWVDIGIEIDGNQSLHLSGLETYYRDNSDLFPSFARQKTHNKQKLTWVGIRSRGSGDKLWRLKMIEPDFLDNKFYFSDRLEIESKSDYDELMREISMTTNTEIKSDDDGLDTLSQIALIDVQYPPFRAKKNIDVFTNTFSKAGDMFPTESEVFGSWNTSNSTYYIHE